MKPCSNACHRLLHLCLLAAVAIGLLSGCSTRKPILERPPAPTPTQPEPAQEAAPAPAPAAEKSDPKARFAEALELMRRKQGKEAEAAFSALVKDFPEFSGPQTNLGILFAKSSRNDAAIAAFSKATVANGQNAPAFNWLGILYRETGQFERALQSYEKALTIRPDYAAAQLNIGLLLDEHMKRPADALPHYREYMRLSGGKDLRVLPWIAEIESRRPKAEVAPTATPEPAASEKKPR